MRFLANVFCFLHSKIAITNEFDELSVRYFFHIDKIDSRNFHCSNVFCTFP